MKINVLQIKDQETTIVLGNPPRDLSSFSAIGLRVSVATAEGSKLLHTEDILPTPDWEEGILIIPSLDLSTVNTYSYKLVGGGEEIAFGKFNITEQQLPTCTAPNTSTGSSSGDSSSTTEEDSSNDSSCADTNIYAGLPSVGIPDFIAPLHIAGDYLLSPEDGYRQLIATDTTNIIIPANSAMFNLGWYCYVLKRTENIVKFVPESSDFTSLHSIDNSREILEVNGMVTVCLTEPDGWQLTGGLA